jgi:hypothetical protein
LKRETNEKVFFFKRTMFSRKRTFIIAPALALAISLSGNHAVAVGVALMLV